MKRPEELLAIGKIICNEDHGETVEGLFIPEYISSPRYEKWKNDVKIFASTLDDSHPLKNDLLTHSLWQNNFVSEMESVLGILDSIVDNEVITKTPSITSEYDLFLSHANKDKSDFVDELYESLKKLGITIFYDKESIEWGDYWKDKILEGTQKAEFAIIVISENFFGREWTEKELDEFLNRQNMFGQKLILPIVHNITNKDLQTQYPSVSEIQTIDSKKHTCDEIAVLFARQLIKRLKSREEI